MLAGPVDAADRQKPDHDRRPEKMTAPISARPSERRWHFDSMERGSCDPALPTADGREAIRAGRACRGSCCRNRGDENPIPSARGNFNIPGRVCRDRPAQSIPVGIRSRFDIGRADSTWLRHRPRFCRGGNHHSRDSTGQEEGARSQDQEEVRSQDQEEEVRSQELAQYKYCTERMPRWLRWRESQLRTPISASSSMIPPSRDRATGSGTVVELDRALTPAALGRPARRPR